MKIKFYKLSRRGMEEVKIDPGRDHELYFVTRAVVKTTGKFQEVTEFLIQVTDDDGKHTQILLKGEI